MERTLTNIATQLVQRHESKRRPVRAIIKHVNYANRHIQVTRNGAYIRHCKVQRGISLGTVNAPIVRVGDVALIERDPVTQKWLCVEIRSKVRCATGNAPASEIEADTGAEVSYTATTQQWSQGITSDFLFDPPVIPLGQLTLPEQQQELICGLPRCTNCAPDGFQSGMALVISSDAEHPSGCWKWGFRQAPCTVFFKAQGAIYDCTPSAGDIPFADVVIAVREKYAYVALRGTVHSGGLTWEPSLLQTWDLTIPSSPVKVDEQEIVAPVGKQYADLGIAVRDDNLWVLGFMYDGMTTITDQEHRITRYDISTRAAPSAQVEWTTEMYSNFTTFRNFNGSAFVGDPYLVGYRWKGANLFNDFIVEDGNSGGEVGTLAGTFDTIPPIVADNVVLTENLSTHTLYAIDCTTVTAPVNLWNTSGTYQPEVYLGTNRAYAKKFPSGDGFKRFTDTDATNTANNITGFTPSFINPYGYFVDNNCLYRAEYSGYAEVWNIADQDNPSFEMDASAPLSPDLILDGCVASADKYSGIVYMCGVAQRQVTATDFKFYLSVLTNRDI